MIGIFIIVTIISATQTIFVGAGYHNVTDETVAYFDDQLVDNLFQHE